MAQQHRVLSILRELEQDSAAFIYPHERLCQSTCVVRFDEQILYSDGEHLTTAGAKLLQPMFVSNLARLVQRSK